jgi:hypothetical protein
MALEHGDGIAAVTQAHGGREPAQTRADDHRVIA